MIRREPHTARGSLTLAVCLLSFVWVAAPVWAESPVVWKAGAARVEITPKRSPLILAAKVAMLLFYPLVCPRVIRNGTEFARLGEASERIGKDNSSLGSARDSAGVPGKRPVSLSSGGAPGMGHVARR